jgi:hypothetical protein
MTFTISCFEKGKKKKPVIYSYWLYELLRGLSLEVNWYWVNINNDTTNSLPDSSVIFSSQRGKEGLGDGGK